MTDSKKSSAVDVLSRIYPQVPDALSSRYERNEDFRELCDPLAELTECIAGLRRGDDPKTDDYLTLHEELEVEFLEAVGRSPDEPRS